MTKKDTDITKHFNVGRTNSEQGVCNIVRFTTDKIDENNFQDIKREIGEYFNSQEGRRLGGKYHALDMSNVLQADSFCISTILTFQRLSLNNSYGGVKITNCSDVVKDMIKKSQVDKTVNVEYTNSNDNYQ